MAERLSIQKGNFQKKNFFFQIAEGDELPSNICCKCEAGLIESYILKEKCRKSFKLLRKILKLPEDENAEKQSQGTQTDDRSQETIENVAEFIPIEVEEIVCVKGEFMATDKMNKTAIVDELDDEIDEEIYEEVSVESNFECEYCNAKFENLDDSNWHQNQHTELLPHLLASIEFYRCSRCLLVFPNLEHLMEHFESNEICEVPTALDRIDYQYLDDIDANETPIRLYSCYKNTKNGMYTCDMCQENFQKLPTFRNHFSELHLENAEQNIGYLLVETPHLCGICGKISENLKNALHHIYFHQREFICPVELCSMNFVEFSELFNHISNEHSLIECFQCTHCFYRAKNRDDLKEHKKKSCAARNYECNDCGRCIRRSY